VSEFNVSSLKQIFHVFELMIVSASENTRTEAKKYVEKQTTWPKDTDKSLWWARTDTTHFDEDLRSKFFCPLIFVHSFLI
jgi:hypothetical protein